MKYTHLIPILLMSSFLITNGCQQVGNKQSENSPVSPSSQLSEKQYINDQISSRETSNIEPQISNENQNNLPENQEEYEYIKDNPFQIVKNSPLSTFSIDVDTASYSNMRRFLNNNQLPPPDAIRIDELINYFDYEYPQPNDQNPFSVTTEVGQTPWNPEHKLVHLGLQGKNLNTEDLPPNNLVFLLDVSGSMNDPNKLPLLKSSFQLLVNQLRPTDKISIVVYAGAAGVVLPPTSGREKDKIMAAINNLEAGGSTAGGEGIELAYKMAEDSFLTKGNNRVILATDGDFNVGLSSDTELVRLIETKRDKGIFLTILGFGYGNLKDSKMEKLSNHGNGNYAYIDTISEAKKVLVEEMGGTLFTIAKDVKIQVEFNPAKVKAYRLIGYENRRLADQDFNDDTKDAGELGAGHRVTALYEIIPVGVESQVKLPDTDNLRYQDKKVPLTSYTTDELMLVKLRYQQPQGSDSVLISQVIKDTNTDVLPISNNFLFSAAVAEFGLLLRDDPYRGDASFDHVLAWANQGKGADLNNYRQEFIELVQKAQLLSK